MLPSELRFVWWKKEDNFEKSLRKCLPLMICCLFVVTVESSQKFNGSVAGRYYNCMCPKNAVIGEEQSLWDIMDGCDWKWGGMKTKIASI